jgi:hypothetical protein
MHQYLLSLHTPYFASSLHSTNFVFSRKMVVKSSLCLWLAACPSPLMAGLNEFQRLVTCSAGFYPTVSLHAAFLIAIELRTHL